MPQKKTFKEIINSDTPVLVDFYATWCGPCKTMAPILDDVKQQIGPKASVLKINIDKNQHAAQVYQVRSVPTLILFQKGQINWRQSGVVPAKELVRLINENAG